MALFQITQHILSTIIRPLLKKRAFRMQTLQELYEFIMQNDRAIVFGNLGRYPLPLYQTFSAIPLIRVVFVADRPCGIASTENRIRIQKYRDPVDHCDLLVFLEPPSMHHVQRHPLAARAVVFTSHYTFRVSPDERWTDACYFHGADAAGTRELVARQDFPVQTRNVGLVQVDHANVLTLSGRREAPPQGKAYVVVDLTGHNRDTLSMYLAFLDVFDYMLRHKELVDRWVVCYSDNGRDAFTRFTQKVVDAVFCRKFEKGAILPLLPFYKSGTIDRTYKVKTSAFGGIRFAAPATVEEACKAAVMNDTLPLVKNVLWLHH